MKITRNLLPPLGLVGALALVPVTTSSLAAADVANYQELETFMSVYERVKANYVEPVDDKTLIRGAIDGMLSALDPHSSYVDASDFDTLRATTDGNYGGLGITVTTEDGTVKVVSPTEDTPAWRAGIKSGDYITHINGELLYGLTLDEAVDKMRGDPGSKIELTIVRPGRDKPFDVALTRERIELRPVKWEIKEGVGYININTFAGNTGDATEAALLAIDKATGGKPLGYVVDLRSNPGGLLDQAIAVSDAFLERGEIVSQRGREKGDIERYYAKPGDMAHGLPVIVLVDAGSASAAEIVAGALQDHRRALVLGEKSFGKGSVQTVIQTGPSSALRLTTALFHSVGPVGAGGRDRPRRRRAAALRRGLQGPPRDPRGGPSPPPAQPADGRRRASRGGRNLERPALRVHRRRAREEGHRGLPAALCAADLEAAGSEAGPGGLVRRPVAVAVSA